MQKYESIEKGIKEKDIKGLRESVGSICYVDRDFSDGEFDQVLSYIESKNINIKDDKLVGNLISSQKSTYNDEDFARAVFELKKNFCDERINDVKKIGKDLYSSKENVNNKKDPNVKSHQNSKSKKVPIIIGILVAAGMIFALVRLIKK